MSLEIVRVKCKSLITKSGLPKSDYVINPFVGCSHGCAYCYARFMGRFRGRSRDSWGSYVFVKEFDSRRFKKDLSKFPKDASLFLGSVTDVYQSIEKEMESTRQILNLLAECPIGVSTLTKSDLVVRDTDLWKRVHHGAVGFSFSTESDKMALWFEGRSRPVRLRLAAMKKLCQEGVDVYAFIGPILPLVTDMTSLLRVIAGHCTTVMAETLNLRCGNKHSVQYSLSRWPPQKRQEFMKLASSPSYWREMRQQYQYLCKRLGLKDLGFFDHARMLQ